MWTPNKQHHKKAKWPMTTRERQTDVGDTLAFRRWCRIKKIPGTGAVTKNTLCSSKPYTLCLCPHPGALFCTQNTPYRVAPSPAACESSNAMAPADCCSQIAHPTRSRAPTTGLRTPRTASTGPLGLRGTWRVWMIFVNEIRLSSTPSNVLALTLVFGAGEKVLQVAVWRPFPAGTKGRQTLTVCSPIRFGIPRCGPVWLFSTGSIAISGMDTPCVAPS